VSPHPSGGSLPFRPLGVERRRHFLTSIAAGRAICRCGWISRRPVVLPTRAIEEHRRRLAPGTSQQRAIENYRVEGEHIPLPTIIGGRYQAVCRTCGRPLEGVGDIAFDHVGEGS
jgi:hypothetical protein